MFLNDKQNQKKDGQRLKFKIQMIKHHGIVLEAVNISTVMRNFALSILMGISASTDDPKTPWR